MDWKKVERKLHTMEPAILEMDEKKNSTNLAVVILFTSFLTVVAYLFSKTTMTILDFHSVTEVKDIEGLVDEVEEEQLEDEGEQADDEGEELEEEEEDEDEEEEEDAKEFLVEDIDDDMPGLTEEYEPLTITREREMDLSGNLRPWTPLPMDDAVLNEVERVHKQVNTLSSNFTDFVETNRDTSTRVNMQIEELRLQLKTFATHEAVDLLCEQIHQLSQKNKFDDVSAIIAEMRTQMATFSTKDSLVTLTQEVSSLKSQVAQMITDMTALMDRMNLVDSLVIEKDILQAWFGKANVVDYQLRGAQGGAKITADVSIRITYSKRMSVADNKAWLSSVMKDDRESHRDGLVGYTDESGWSFDAAKKTAIKRYHTNEWSGNTVDVHVDINVLNSTGNNSGSNFAQLLTDLYHDKKITWERQLLSA